tara:strand:- start:1764 stop:2804 length:1041 start_codon:yes stop_codon:yes gene_type:complete
MEDKIYLSSMSRFHAARKLQHIEDTRFRNLLHGHNFKATIKTEFSKNNLSLELLNQKLNTQVTKFNYAYLNDFMSEPSDLHLADRIFKECEDISPINLTVSSTDYTGALINSHSVRTLWKSFTFQASHQLPNVADDHKCKNMHGHTFRVVLYLEPLSDQKKSVGIERVCNDLKDELDKKCLNKIKGLENPTSEILASWVWSKLISSGTPIVKVEVMENINSGCMFNGVEHEIWKQYNLETAISYNQDKEIYGFGYKTKLFIKEPLDKVKGWVMDFGDIKEIFKPIFNKMDHHYLNEIEGLSNPSIVDVVKWMRIELKKNPQLSKIDLYESEGIGVEININKDRHER